jgi:hypothetical protein
MRLSLGNNYAFNMQLVGYQFPELANVPYDSNWLNVRIDIQHPDGNWTAVDPALLTYEAQRLADWLRNLAAGRRDQGDICFLEPCLEFDVVASEGSSEALKVILAQEFRPPWFTSVDNEEFELTFPLVAIALLDAAEQLEADLARYPQRTAQ